MSCESANWISPWDAKDLNAQNVREREKIIRSDSDSQGYFLSMTWSLSDISKWQKNFVNQSEILRGFSLSN